MIFTFAFFGNMSTIDRYLFSDTFQIRYEGALARKSQILDIIRSLELPNNPLDDIIDQVGWTVGNRLMDFLSDLFMFVSYFPFFD